MTCAENWVGEGRSYTDNRARSDERGVRFSSGYLLICETDQFFSILIIDLMSSYCSTSASCVDHKHETDDMRNNFMDEQDCDVLE